jgi:hypothetical protein
MIRLQRPKDDTPGNTMEMTKQAEPTIEKPAVTRRFIACAQSTGRVGKSTVAEGLISWLRYAGIEFAAVDADSQHQTLSRRYPEYVEIFDATKTFDDFARMVQALPNLPVILVDFPAQATDFLLSAAAHFRLLDFFERSGIRPTLLIFAADDPTAKESASDTIRFFGEAADYLLVENPAKYKSDEFRRTALRSWLTERKTPTLRIQRNRPSLSSTSTGKSKGTGSPSFKKTTASSKDMRALSARTALTRDSIELSPIIVLQGETSGRCQPAVFFRQCLMAHSFVSVPRMRSFNL